jgi:antitoxin ParD1/3/4
MAASPSRANSAIDLFPRNGAAQVANWKPALGDKQGLTILAASPIFESVMAATTMNISLTPELRASIDGRVRTGRYGNASDVIRAGLRALHREEMTEVWREWQEAKAKLPRESASPAIEQRVESRVRALRRAERRKGAD